MRGKTQCIARTTPKPTPLNHNPLLWQLFDRAKIAMPVAEAYEYSEIEREDQERRVLAALLKEAEYNLKADAEVTAQLQAMGIALPCGYCGCTEPLDTSYSDEGYGWPCCPQCKGV
jgi:hypothetical protein